MPVFIVRSLIFLLALVLGFFFGSLNTESDHNMALPELQQPENVLGAPIVSAVETPKDFVNADERKLNEIKFVCRDERLRPIWIDLLREIGGNFFLGALKPEFDCSDVLHIAETDLNDDGKAEYAVSVQDIRVCSPTANCPAAIYGVFDDERSRMRTSAGVYDFSLRNLLFEEGMIGYELQETKSYGYRDLILRHNGGNHNDNLFLYKFDGEKYQLSRCYDQDKGSERKTKISCSGFNQPDAE